MASRTPTPQYTVVYSSCGEIKFLGPFTYTEDALAQALHAYTDGDLDFDDKKPRVYLLGPDRIPIPLKLEYSVVMESS